MDAQRHQEILDMIYEWTKSLVPELGRFINDLADLEPEIQPLITEHIRDNNEMLPTLLMGDIARWAVSVAGENQQPETRLAPFFARLEDAWGDGQNNVADLIATSFVENVYDEPDVVKLLGPKLAHHYRVLTGQEQSRPEDARPMPEVMKRVLKKLGRL